MTVNDRLRISKSAAGLIVMLSGVLWHYSRLPLHHTDLWGHLAYGQWIAEHGRLPATEPFMPLARGVPMVDTAWLAQLILFRMDQGAGLPGVQFLHAIAIAIATTAVIGAVYSRTRSGLAGLFALATLLAVEWFQFRVIRPQMAGFACFSLLLALVGTDWPRRTLWMLSAALFVAWGNLHGSFVMGLGLLGTLLLGRILDVVWQAGREFLQRQSAMSAGTRRLRASDALRGVLSSVCRDRQTVNLCGCLVMASLAVLINPYGGRLFVEVLSFAGNPNLRDLIEWLPLNFGTWQGRIWILMVALLIATIPLAKPRWNTETWLPVVVFGAAAVWSARLLIWWGPIVAACLGIRVGGIRGERSSGQPAGASIRLTYVPLALAACALLMAVASSPFGLQMRTGDKPDIRLCVSAQTPVEAVAWLRDHPPSGQIYNSYEWGDYLLWAGPADVAVFVTSHVHLIPAALWRDYRTIAGGGPDALAQLDNYGVQSALIDRSRQRRLVQRLSADPQWRLVYSDDLAAIYSRSPLRQAVEPPANRVAPNAIAAPASSPAPATYMALAGLVDSSGRGPESGETTAGGRSSPGLSSCNTGTGRWPGDLPEEDRPSHSGCSTADSAGRSSPVRDRGHRIRHRARSLRRHRQPLFPAGRIQAAARERLENSGCNRRRKAGTRRQRRARASLYAFEVSPRSSD